MKAVGFCAEWGKSWSHKEEQQELEEASKLGAHCACRVRVQNKGEAEQGASSAKCSPGPHWKCWKCACREAGKAAKGHVPAREEAESQGEQVATQRHQGKGWRHLPNQSSTAAKRLGWREWAISALLNAWVATELD